MTQRVALLQVAAATGDLQHPVQRRQGLRGDLLQEIPGNVFKFEKHVYSVFHKIASLSSFYDHPNSNVGYTFIYTQCTTIIIIIIIINIFNVA